MGHIYFVRHGQTYWNVANKICGATDIGLTPEGKRQAEETGRKILEEGIQADLILYSPLSRAADTAAEISRITGIPMQPEERLREQNFGKYEGTARNGEEFRLAKRQFPYRYDGGESMLHLAQRIYNLLDELRDLTEDKTVILVAHNGIARVVNSYFYEMTNEEYGDFGVKNCQIMRYDFQKEYKIRTADLCDAEALAAVEAACFPAAEAATKEQIRDRLAHYKEHFLVLTDRTRIISFVDGMVTDERELRDEMYENANLHNEEGRWQMIFGVNTIPEYRRQGCAGMLLREFIGRAREQGRLGLVLTCKKELLDYYASFGFVSEGISESVHGGVVWYRMRLTF